MSWWSIYNRTLTLERADNPVIAQTEKRHPIGSLKDSPNVRVVRHLSNLTHMRVGYGTSDTYDRSDLPQIRSKLIKSTKSTTLRTRLCSISLV